MAADPNDFGPGLQVKGGLRYLYKRFSFGGDESTEYAENIERIFGKKEKKFCEECGRLPSWCDCVPPPSSETDPVR